MEEYDIDGRAEVKNLDDGVTVVEAKGHPAFVIQPDGATSINDAKVKCVSLENLGDVEHYETKREEDRITHIVTFKDGGRATAIISDSGGLNLSAAGCSFSLSLEHVLTLKSTAAANAQRAVAASMSVEAAAPPVPTDDARLAEVTKKFQEAVEAGDPMVSFAMHDVVNSALSSEGALIDFVFAQSPNGDPVLARVAIAKAAIAKLRDFFSDSDGLSEVPDEGRFKH